ncbi:DUF1488 domain-containing protein [Cronobacter universalis]|uniref:Protein of uncharacterized function (DUF1488) n=1 Tax=Cronobacter universalis NCTC 9529 TaxID=1074000 RepID=A0AAC8VSU9_9ENTR|nr:DUF1488 domain-containing protein [Cronobacter universalis]ALB56425.1 hypothetical protein AFK65_17825 [Cronobacter universalis NCTC 9529]ELY3469257.1 DUF1488 domain-containing protein [Cronobacter universalis]ELY3761883.1 DUF1488 domain-containing protein [Cronobacter universalis]ELY6247506.1 DUF1488 domain-containing protein [Cronobacter universalis]ELY7393808.1 DUF1488 domain-containing protein [Cronobacter universalis]
MNQAIQFPDREQWDEQRQAVCFPALVNGLVLTCAIPQSVLVARFSGKSPEDWIAAFRQHRWDLEEEAEQLIAAQEEDNQGWVWLS